MGLTALVASPEDTILSKLEWARMGSSERQMRDARGVAALQLDRLDLAYLRRWAAELGVADRLEQVLCEAEQLQRPADSPESSAGDHGALLATVLCFHIGTPTLRSSRIESPNSCVR